jgi:signal peptide peptidase SppA
MRYEQILAAFYSTPLGLLPAKIEAIRRFLHTKAAGGDVDPAEIEEIVRARRDAMAEGPLAAAFRRQDGALQIGRVAVVSIFGTISQRCGMLEQASGGVSCEQIGRTLDSLAADKGVRSVVLGFDSPGGSVFGVQELGDKIRGMRDQKKTVGVADSMAASAAYWLLSQCAEINVTPGGMVGSIGVFCAHEDWSKYDEELGVKTTLVSAGDYKVEGNPFEPLNAEAKEQMQKQVDAYYSAFVAAVAKGRGVSESRVKSDFGKGRMVLAKDAVSCGMADRVATLSQVLTRLGAYEDGGSGSASASSAGPRPPSLCAARLKLAEAEAE